MTISIEEMATFCKRKGFIYQNSEIYGGIAGFFDYAHLGVELKNNIKREWWKYHVHNRSDIVGIDGAIISNPKVWKASGHLDNFEDLMLTCSKCKNKIKAETFIEEKLNIQTDSITSKEINDLISKNKLSCPHCKSTFQEVQSFNLMFSTNVGPKEGSKAYLRPETAQNIFTNFKLVAENARMKTPFGIAQIGKSFRNEISPREFLFRCREFEQMEIEYFVDPNNNKCPYYKDIQNYELLVLKGKKAKKMKIKDAKIKDPWHAYWLVTEHKWFTDLNINTNSLRIRKHLDYEKSHYAIETWDLEYNFPFGWREIEGISNRSDYDLSAHINESKKDLSLYDEDTKKKIVPHVVAEPSLGLDRAFLVFLFEAYNDDKKRGNIVLSLHPKLSPIEVGVFPLVNKLNEPTKKLFNDLKNSHHCFYDSSGSIGRRYARADEVGIPLCITFDFDSLKNKDVTIRDRNTTKQVRVKMDKLNSVISTLLQGTR